MVGALVLCSVCRVEGWYRNAGCVLGGGVGEVGGAVPLVLYHWCCTSGAVPVVLYLIGTTYGAVPGVQCAIPSSKWCVARPHAGPIIIHPSWNSLCILDQSDCSTPYGMK